MQTNAMLKRLLAMLMALAICFTIVPWTVLAADGDTATYTRISSMDELTTGQYVLVTSEGYAPLVLDGTWVTVAAPIVEGNTVTDAADAVWTITVDGSSATLTDSNGVSIAPKSGDNNGIQSGSYSWAVACTDGTFTFSGVGDDTTILASNKSSGNKLRAYRTTTVSGSPSSYLSAFTLYKLNEGTSGGEPTGFTGGKYVIWEATNGKAATALASTYTFGYLSGTAVTLTDGTLSGYGETNAFTFTASGDGYTIQDSYGRYLYMTGTYNSFNVTTTLPESGAEWTVTAQEDGTYLIANVAMSKTLAWSTEYSSYGAYATPDSATQLASLTLTAYVEPTTGGDSGEVTEPTEPEEPETPAATQTATLVTDVTSLAVGDEVIIAATGFDAALSTNQKNNNRGQATVTKNTEKTVVTFGEDTQILTLAAGTTEGTWAFYTGEGYLYAASSTANHLKTRDTLDANGSWSIEIDATGEATLLAQGSNTRNWLRYNNGSGLFSCYLSGQSGIAIYKVDKASTDPWADEDKSLNIYSYVDSLSDGDTVVVYNPGNGKMVSSQFNENKYYLAGVDATVKEGGYIASDADYIEWMVSITETDDGKTYTFKQGDDVVLGILKSGTYFNLKTGVSDTTDNGFILLQTGEDSGMYYVYSSTLEGSYGHVYLEWYAAKNGFSPYCTGADRVSETNFGFTFYKLVREAVKEDEGEEPTTTDYTLTDAIAAGDTVVMYNAGSSTMLSSTASGYKLSGVAATPAENVISTADTTVAWVVGVDADGNYTFTQGDLVLGMVPSETYVNLSTSAFGGYTGWVLENSTTDNVFYVKNATMSTDSYSAYYIEYYSGYTAFGSTSPSDSAFGISFYKLGGTEPETPTTDGIADGTYVIWNPNYNVTVANSFSSSNYMLGTTITPVGDTVTGYSNIDIWTVKNSDDGTFTISQNGKYFGNNASGYIVVEEAPLYPNWKLTTLEDGTIYLTNAGSGKDLEWFASYSDWSMYFYKEADKAMYALRFTPASPVYNTDSEVVSNIAQWGGGGPYDATTNATQVLGDRYIVGDQKDTGAVFTVVAKGVTAQPYQTTTPSTGGTSYYMGGTNVGASAGDYLQFAVNTAGWGDMTLAFRMRATKTAPGSFQLCYSTDGGSTWQNFNTGSYAYSYVVYNTDGSSYPVNASGDITNGVAQPALAPAYYVSFSFDVPAGADNCGNLLIRLMAGTTRADGDTTKAISGNIRIDSVVLSGSPIVDSSVTTHVTVEPNGEDEDQAVGTELTMTSEDSATIYYRVDGGEWQTYDASSKPTLASLPCDVETYAKAEGKSASALVLYHYAAGTVANVKMDPNGGGVYIASGDTKAITMTCATGDATIYYMVSTDNEVWPEEWTEYGADTETDAKNLVLAKGFGKLYVQAYAVKDGFKDSSVVKRSFTERTTSSYGLYFGQIHSHTNISDGAGSIEEAYNYAKNTADHIDFLAVTDHSNSFDNTGSGVLAEDASLVSEEWKLAKETALAYTDDSFVGIYGYEMTWSNGLGHMNTYNTPGFQSRTQAAYSTYATALKNYYDTLTTVNDSISQFNHPGTTFGDFQDFSYYTEAYDELITLIEVGNGEGAIGSSGYFPSYEYYTRALDKGWHVAPTNNQDNHKGLWGNANTGRTVVLADSLTEEGIYDAMRNYRVYATEDNDLSIYYTLNGNTMGSILDMDAGDELVLKVQLSDPTDSRIGKVEVIVNGGLSIAEYTVEGSSETVTFTLENNYSYYYIKVTQADGDIAVTAPVWTGDVEACGISSFTTDAAVAVQDQALNLTLELYNNESSPLYIKNIDFTIDGEVIHTADLTDLSKIKKLSTGSYSFSYTHKDVGNVEIYVTVTAELDGVEKIYTDKLSLTYVPEEMVTRVIVDGTHYNDYVTGYYGGNITNLTTIAAENQIEVTVVKDQITAEMLKECQLLIISAPAKKSGTSNTGDYVAKPFEDEFIQLVVDYVKDGGSVVLCGLADYGEASCDAELHTAAQINKLLAALGSTMSLNDDEVLDPENNGGQAYRLYPTNFNMDSQWCAGIVDGQQYSQYSGCSVNPGKGTWLVKGYDTTFGGDSDKDGVGNTGKEITYIIKEVSYTYSVVCDEGDVVFLATEETGYGGNIFLSGGVFVSDFEVKAELDNIWDLPYANRTIIENILGVVQVELPLSTIEEMRHGELGDVFRIRGYVTAGTDNENTTFFDAIYVQDETGGTTVFPFSLSGVAIGTPIEIIGYVDEYQGDREIQVMSYKILDADSKVYEPEKMSNKDAMDYASNGGQLIQVEGEVVEVTLSGETGVAQFVVKDSNGDLAKVFIDGYILSGTTGKNELASIVKVGNTVSAVGLLYLHPEGNSEESVAVLRVRDCDEIKLVKTGNSGSGSGSNAKTSDIMIVTVSIVMTVSVLAIAVLLMLMKKNRKA